jgi:hypothetical protein
VAEGDTGILIEDYRVIYRRGARVTLEVPIFDLVWYAVGDTVEGPFVADVMPSYTCPCVVRFSRARRCRQPAPHRPCDPIA